MVMNMMNKNITILFLFFFSFISVSLEACVVKKLFVFGDSFVDTGNFKKGAGGWIVPYGITFPGTPTGRFSDGRVLTDYIATYFGLKSPVALNYWKTNADSSKLRRHGMNFACGGSGVFNTFEDFPNITTQIDSFQHLVDQNIYSQEDLNSSVAFVSVGSNDYVSFAHKNATSIQEWPELAVSIINQLTVDLKRIQDLGVRKIAVTTLEPLGCMPSSVAELQYKSCNEKWNKVSDFHNQKLVESVLRLNNDTNKHVVEIVDLNGAIMSIVNRFPESLKFNSLKACCEGITSNYTCGLLDENGTKMYKVCKHRNLSLFWDGVHPSQHGWHLIFSVLRSSLYRLYM